MALNEQEKQILQYAKDNNKSLVEAKAAIARYRRENPVTVEQATQSSGFLEKTAKGLDVVFGGGKIGEAIGTKIAEMRATPEERAAVAEFGSDTFKGPSAGEVAGDVLRVGSTFAPVARTAGLVSKGLQAIGLRKGAEVVGKTIAGGATGAIADVGVTMSEGQQAELGLGTIIGAGIPVTSPIAKAISKAGAKLAGKATSEVSGALTGTSAETIEQAFEASRTGGKQLDDYTSALRGKTTPEALVETMRENVAKVSNAQQQLFKNTLSELSETVVSTQPAKTSFVNQLAETGITVNENGILDFSGSKLRTVPNAQAKLQQAYDEIRNMPDQLPLGEIDTTRQAIKGIKSIGGDEPSANLANMLIDDAVRSVRTAGEQVKGYGQMLDNFGETADFLDEVQKALSSGDRATVDQAYRRMATSLRTNNEQRMALVRELDQVTGGAILSEISGQQLSEALPRGIFRQIAAGLAGTGIVTGGITPSLLPALVFASPRITGEFVRALGIGTAKADAVISALADARGLLTKIGAISGAESSVQ